MIKSPYAYGWNNPTNLTDPDGNCPLCPIIVPILEGIAARQVVTTVAVAATAVVVVSNASKFKESNYLVRRDGTSTDVQLSHFMLNTNEKQSDGDLLNGGNRIDDDKIKSSPLERGRAPSRSPNFLAQIALQGLICHCSVLSVYVQESYL